MTETPLWLATMRERDASFQPVVQLASGSTRCQYIDRWSTTQELIQCALHDGHRDDPEDFRRVLSHAFVRGDEIVLVRGRLTGGAP